MTALHDLLQSPCDPPFQLIWKCEQNEFENERQALGIEELLTTWALTTASPVLRRPYLKTAVHIAALLRHLFTDSVQEQSASCNWTLVGAVPRITKLRLV